MRKKNKYFFIPLLSVVFLLCSCSTVDFSEINSTVIRGNYSVARKALEAQKENLYTENDLVLYNLDSGVLSHYAGEWDQSNNNLATAEKLIEMYYSKSISQGISSYFVNDMVIDYAGEDYEDIYTNFFMALNYIQLGKFDDAMVEIRRFDNKQKLLSTKYDAELEYASQELGSDYSDVSIQFQNSAAARYLSMLLYRANGQSDSAEVDRKLLVRAFEDQPSLYDFNIPSCVNEELSVPRGKARLNFICFTGQAPTKVEDVSRIYIGDGVYCKIAFPLMIDRGSSVSSISVDVYDASGEVISSVAADPDDRVVEIPVSAAEESASLVKEEMEKETGVESDDASSRSSAARARALAMGIKEEEPLKRRETVSWKKKEETKTPAVSLEGLDVECTTMLEKIESIENIALDTFIQHSNVIYSRGMIRAIGKTLKTGALSLASEFSDDSTVSLVFSLLSAASQVSDEITEQADLRTSRFFPANIYVGGLTLDPGVYTIVVTFRGNSGQVLSSNTYENVNVSAKSINLVEAICPR
ncbi:MAG: hypothetical protein K5930_01980 [Treponemataceae bacterium]|nr:hypothetical protein [Treponemataceae bacterium]